MKTENLQPKDEPRTKVCPDCRGAECIMISSDPEIYETCSLCNGTGEIVIDDEHKLLNNDNDE